MEQYLIDTNVVSDYFSASLSATGINFLDTVGIMYRSMKN